jgi:hypothetical protein
MLNGEVMLELLADATVVAGLVGHEHASLAHISINNR